MVAARPLVLRATPRTLSTAFDRMMRQRGDHIVLTEPWSRWYYFGADGPSDRFDEVLADSSPAAIRRDRDRRAARAGVREGDGEPPRPAEALSTAYDLACEAHATEGLTAPVVLDGREVRARPAALIAAWCDEIGIEFVPEALRWEPGVPRGADAQCELWANWFEGAVDSNGFDPPSDDPPPTVDDLRVRAPIDRARPIYERLHSRRLRA